MKKYLIFYFSFIIHLQLCSQVGIGTKTPNVSAALDINSTSKGFLPPRMTTAQINDIFNPANGLVIYNTTLHKLCVRENGVWKQITTTAM